MHYEFDKRTADLAVQFFARKLRLVEGESAGREFVLMPWLEKITRELFGWKRPDGTRRYRTAYISVPRKNAKTTYGAGLALWGLLCDGEQAPQVYSAAGDREQARICFRIAKEMIAADARLTAETDVYQHSIVGKRLNGSYKALSAEAYSKHGYNPSFILFDELHVQPNRELWDVLRTGMGARRQPLTVAITTAGHDRTSLCWELDQKARAILRGEERDDSFLPVVYGADESDDWTDPKVWAKANPSLGKTLKLDFLREACESAKKNPAEENTFRNLHLNQWTEQSVRAIPMRDWDDCGQPFDWRELTGEACYLGVDLATTRDVAALACVFPRSDGSFKVLPHFWIPRDNADIRAKQDKGRVLRYVEQGHVTATPGNETDYAAIRAKVMECCRTFRVQKLAFDPWNAAGFTQGLVNDGFREENLVKFPQSIANFTEPTKRLIELVIAHKFNHGGNPVLRWMASNFAARVDASGNQRPDKGASSEKIDGIVAAIMGLGLAITDADNGTTVYERENRGFISIG